MAVAQPKGDFSRAHVGTQDENLTFHASDPDLTPCFQKTVLVWVPCAFLFVLSPLQGAFIVGSRSRHIPWTLLNTAKLLLTCLLAALCVVDIGFAISFGTQEYLMNTVDYVTPAIKLVTLVLCCILQYCNKNRGLRTSGVLFIFWFLLALFGAVQFRYEIRQLQNDEPPDPLYPVISYIIFYAITLVIFFFNFFLDGVPKEYEYEDIKRPCPEIRAPFPIRLLFLWFDKFVWKTYRSSITADELWGLKPEESSRFVVPAFEKYWNKTLRKSQNFEPKAKLCCRFGSVDFEKINKKTVSVLPALCKAFGPIFLCSSGLMLCNVVVTFINPQLLSNLIAFVSSNDPLWLGITYAALMLVFALLQPVFSGNGTVLATKTAVRVRMALTSIVYRKRVARPSLHDDGDVAGAPQDTGRGRVPCWPITAAQPPHDARRSVAAGSTAHIPFHSIVDVFDRIEIGFVVILFQALTMSNNAKKESTVGEIVNLMSVDTTRIYEAILNLNWIWISPLQIAISLYFLWQIVG
ncbi:hypothetical protein PR048_001195 [Dryococelus australis]|uniref:ABC transmembrane type-1 domain-containing protein n=1 Tax=Dryococelus australis TaxID=614101 RepID=A0ABQ9IGR8_9NEOP|nr:hypothetical protein PR048_001195 [Dryococelus australis]